MYSINLFFWFSLNIKIKTPSNLSDVAWNNKGNTFYLRRLKKIIIKQIEKDYEEIGKTIKDLTFSYMDKQAELRDDGKNKGRKFDY